MKNTSGFTHWVIVILIFVLAIGLVGAAWWYEVNRKKTDTPIKTDLEINANTSVNTNTGVDNIKNWLTYENEEIGFSFRYPAEWGVIIRDEVKNNIYGLAGKQFLLTASNFDTWQGHFDKIPIIYVTSTDYQKPDLYSLEGEGFIWNNDEGPAEICQEVANSLDASTQCSILEGTNTYVLNTAVVYTESNIEGFSEYSGLEDWIWYERHAFISLNSNKNYGGIHLRYSLMNEQRDELLNFSDEQIKNYGESNLPLILDQFADKIIYFDNFTKTVLPL